jgi:AcrR family transcriptional regulator
MKKPNSSAKAPAPYHHGNLHDALIDAAWIKIQEQGFEPLSLAALAKELGVSQAAPYRHFSDRDALLAAVSQRGFVMLSTAIEAIVKSNSRKESALSRFAHTYARFGTENPEIYRLMYGSPLFGKMADDAEPRVMGRYILQMLLETLTDIPDPKQRKHKAVHVWAALHGAVLLNNQHLLSKKAIMMSLTDLVDTIIET